MKIICGFGNTDEFSSNYVVMVFLYGFMHIYIQKAESVLIVLNKLLRLV